MKKVTTKSKTAKACDCSKTTAQCCSKSSKIVAGCHD